MAQSVAFPEPKVVMSSEISDTETHEQSSFMAASPTCGHKKGAIRFKKFFLGAAELSKVLNRD